MEEIKIIIEPSDENPFCVVYKPCGMPSAPLNEDDKNNAFSKAAEIFPKLLSVNGKKEIEHGLLHRIDNETEGLLLICATQDFYDYMQKEQSEGRFIKYYSAQCNHINISEKPSGFPEMDPKYLKQIETNHKVQISSYFRNFGKGQKEVRPVLLNEKGAIINKVGKLKQYTTDIYLVKKENGDYYFECKISSGYRHQVRCHLAWLGFPVSGDKIYNPEPCGQKMKFKANKIQFFYNGKEYII